MKNSSFFFFSVFFISVALNGFTQKLTILHTNDVHSKLTGYGPDKEYSPELIHNDGTRGGFARLSTLFQNFRAKSPESSLILDAGDYLMGSLFQVSEEETGFQLNLMKTIGYDYITIGNHEFDFGPKTFAGILTSAKARGGFPQIIASNVSFSNKSAEDDSLEKFYQDKSILPYSVINRNGLKIGILGLMGLDAASVAPAAKPVEFTKPLKAASKIARLLKSEHKADIVILLSHCGIHYDSENKKYSGEDIEIAKKVPEIDLIIGGHTHTSTPRYIKEGNAYIVQTGSNGTEVGEINLNFENGKITEFRFNLIPVDDNIKGDVTVDKQIENQINHINQKYLSPVGLTYDQMVGKTAFDLKINYSDLVSSNLGPFIADATYKYIAESGNKADFCIVASGTIREDMLTGEKGIQTVSDMFRIMSLGKGYDNVPGYPIAKMYITGQEVKKMLEALVMSRASGGDGFIYFSGIKTWINPKKGFLKKVVKAEINGVPVDFSKKNEKLYSVSANTYLLSFIGRIKKMSYGLLRVVPKDKNGIRVTDMKNQLIDIDPVKEGVQEAKEWISLIEFMKSFETGVDGIPQIPDKYRKGDESFIIEK